MLLEMEYMGIFLDSLSTESKTGSGMQPSLRSLVSRASQVLGTHKPGFGLGGSMLGFPVPA